MIKLSIHYDEIISYDEVIPYDKAVELPNKDLVDMALEARRKHDQLQVWSFLSDKNIELFYLAVSLRLERGVLQELYSNVI